jgi:DNA polymerase III epsilon subunit-like protein
MNILIFDTETSGLLPKGKLLVNENLHLFPHTVQFSWIIFDQQQNKIIKIQDYIIKLPENFHLSEENIKIHGITNEMSQSKGVDISVAIDEFIKDYYISTFVVAHNLDFDLKIIRADMMRILSGGCNENSAKKYKKFIDELKISTKFYCTMEESIDLCDIKMTNDKGKEYKKYPKLSELHYKLFQSVPKNLHNSLNDVLVCLRCFYKMTFEKDILELSDELNNLFKNLLI